jgi:hypothetical protein
MVTLQKPAMWPSLSTTSLDIEVLSAAPTISCGGWKQRKRSDKASCHRRARQGDRRSIADQITCYSNQGCGPGFLVY